MSLLVAVVGATGTGKSELALDLAERLIASGTSAEIVNADAMQLYRGMDIGTAKVPAEERRGIPHHLIDVLAPTEEASVARYQTEARALVEEVLARGAVPILVGGSGLYVSSVVYDFRFPGTDAHVRAGLEAELAEHGPGRLHEQLLARDPDAATAIGPHNGRRLVRALEVIELTGEPFGSGLPDAAGTWRPTVTLGLRREREHLVPSLDARVERMWEAGLVDEVERLRPAGLGTTASRAIGYAQALAQLDGRLDRAGAIAETQSLTRRYARRQVSWFGRSRDTNWFASDDPGRVDAALGVLRTAADRLPR
ncbi:MAG: tRNA (adenosine(37)-N6)-dimethylallyltransferase MiaA [Leifsonia xyli]|nr:MAG: tRNA (adenosine(37)-N6)-dimethylallyltransferase MiaA [Leifsonia xyli]